MVPQQAHKWIGWENKETRPRNIFCERVVQTDMKTNLITVIDLLKITKEKLDKADCKIDGQNVKARLEVSPQRRPLTKAQALLYKGLKEMGGDESKVRDFYGNFRRSSFWEEILLAKYARQDEGWVIDMHVVSTMCTDLHEIF